MLRPRVPAYGGDPFVTSEVGCEDKAKHPWRGVCFGGAGVLKDMAYADREKSFIGASEYGL